jgi:hypothetical protein
LPLPTTPEPRTPEPTTALNQALSEGKDLEAASEEADPGSTTQQQQQQRQQHTLGMNSQSKKLPALFICRIYARTFAVAAAVAKKEVINFLCAFLYFFSIGNEVDRTVNIVL